MTDVTKLCKNYFKGKCDKGKACKYHHNGPCVFFKKGTCNKGDDCVFQHGAIPAAAANGDVDPEATGKNGKKDAANDNA